MSAAILTGQAILLLTCAIYLRLWFCPNRVRMIRRDWARLRARGKMSTPFRDCMISRDAVRLWLKVDLILFAGLVFLWQTI